MAEELQQVMKKIAAAGGSAVAAVQIHESRHNYTEGRGGEWLYLASKLLVRLASEMETAPTTFAEVFAAEYVRAIKNVSS